MVHLRKKCKKTGGKRVNCTSTRRLKFRSNNELFAKAGDAQNTAADSSNDVSLDAERIAGNPSTSEQYVKIKPRLDLPDRYCRHSTMAKWWKLCFGKPMRASFRRFPQQSRCAILRRGGSGKAEFDLRSNFKPVQSLEDKFLSKREFWFCKAPRSNDMFLGDLRDNTSEIIYCPSLFLFLVLQTFI